MICSSSYKYVNSLPDNKISALLKLRTELIRKIVANSVEKFIEKEMVVASISLSSYYVLKSLLSSGSWNTIFYQG